jgi:hypothetical protein
MEIEEKNKKVMFVGFEVMRVEDFFRMIGKNEEEIKEEKKHIMEDILEG